MAIQIQRGDLILFEGDSITARKAPPAMDDWPFLRLMNWHRSYADVVQEWLFCNRPELALRFRNGAVGGSAIAEVASRFDPVVAALRPNLIVMTLGANDAARNTPLGGFEHAVREYARKTHELCGARILVVGGLRPCPPELEEPRPHWSRVPEYAAAVRRAISGFEGEYLDAGSRLYANAMELRRQCDLHTVFSDGGHFNEVANQILAAEVLRHLGLLIIPGRQ